MTIDKAVIVAIVCLSVISMALAIGGMILEVMS